MIWVPEIVQAPPMPTFASARVCSTSTEVNIRDERLQHLYRYWAGRGNEDSLPARLAARPAHVERLQALKAEGRLLVAGPNPAIDSEDPGDAGFTGSIIIAEFESLRAAQAWADEDPYVKQGVYASVTVKPFNKVLP